MTQDLRARTTSPVPPPAAGIESLSRAGRMMRWLYRHVPAFGADLMAGLTVATVAVPQAMAYATLAGLPPQYGLYTAIIMTAVGALLDSSRQLINGPTNAIAIAMLSALAMVPDEGKGSAAIM